MPLQHTSPYGFTHIAITFCAAFEKTLKLESTCNIFQEIMPYTCRNHASYTSVNLDTSQQIYWKTCHILKF